MTKTIKIEHFKRESLAVSYYLELQVSASKLPRVISGLERFEIRTRETVFSEGERHRLRVSVMGTEHISSDHKLSTAFDVLGDLYGLTEISREELNQGDVQEINFELEIESPLKTLHFDVVRPFSTARHVNLKQVQKLPGGEYACVHCGSLDITPSMDRRMSSEGGPIFNCNGCYQQTPYVRKDRHVLFLSVIQTPDKPADERLEEVLSTVRGAATRFTKLDLRQV